MEAESQGEDMNLTSYDSCAARFISMMIGLLGAVVSTANAVWMRRPRLSVLMGMNAETAWV